VWLTVKLIYDHWIEMIVRTCRFTGSEDISSLVRMHSSVLGQSAPTLSTTMVSNTVV
jgi:hypothetical protein